MSVVLLGVGFFGRYYYRTQMMKEYSSPSQVSGGNSIGAFDPFNKLDSLDAGSASQSQIQAINAMLNFGSGSSRIKATFSQQSATTAPADVQTNPFVDKQGNSQRDE